MERHVLEVLRDPELVEVRASHFARLEAVYAGEALEHVFVLCGLALCTEDAGPEWERWLEESLGTAAAHAEAAKDPLIFRPLTVTYNPYGVHFIDELLGADAFRMEDGSWQARVLRTPIGELARPDLEASGAWRQAQAVTRGFIERDAPGVLFGLPTLSSALNVAVNLYGQEIIVAMMTEPEAAARDLKVINDVICELHQWYLEALPREQLQCIVPAARCQPPGFGQLCGCSTQLLSPSLYRDFIAPLDEELLSVYPRGGMIHLCGAHTHHNPVWSEMSALRAVQTNDRASEDVEAYFEELREDQVLYVNLCEEVSVERIMEATGGRRVVIPADLREAPRARG